MSRTWANVFGGMRSVAYKRELHGGGHVFKRAAHFQRVVLGLHAADVEKVVSWLKPQAANRFICGDLFRLGTIRNERALLVVPFAIVALDHFRIANHAVRKNGGPGTRTCGTKFWRTSFHFLRLRSMPSTFSATGIPHKRGKAMKMALAALQYRTAFAG